MAYAAIGAGDAGGSPAEGTPSAGNRGPVPTAAPTGTGSVGRPVAPGPSGATTASGAPAAGRDTEAHCRAYERVEGRGHALEATAWRRLVEAAGGEGHVAEYCARQHARQTGPATAGHGNDGAGATGNNGTAANAGGGPGEPARASGNPGDGNGDGNDGGNATGGKKTGQDRGRGE
ncbi:hypothetical protein AB0D84_12600 [Streptomyces sp. NPDC048193]|uniref:hypothetical protein n=1 Tax=Streptomyces sp. NPDC048193 TaxID=3155630 RepID=UPI0034362239